MLRRRLIPALSIESINIVDSMFYTKKKALKVDHYFFVVKFHVQIVHGKLICILCFHIHHCNCTVLIPIQKNTLFTKHSSYILEQT